MSRFFVSPENINIKEKKIFINGSENHHLSRVLRLKQEEEIVVFDGSGKEYEGTIKEISSQKTIVEIKRVQEKREDKQVKMTLAQAIPKKAKIKDIIDKTTQLGICTIIPIVSTRTIVRPSKEKEKLHLEKWQKIALESSKQCGRTKAPHINQITNFKDLISLSSQYDLALMPSLLGKRKELKNIYLRKAKKIIFFIGPEGGWTKQEIDLAEKNKVILIDLGGNVLKTDTAAIATMAILDFILCLI